MVSLSSRAIDIYKVDVNALIVKYIKTNENPDLIPIIAHKKKSGNGNKYLSYLSGELINTYNFLMVNAFNYDPKFIIGLY